MPILYKDLDEALREVIRVAADNEGAIAIFSYELSYGEISKKLLALKTGLPIERISRNSASRSDLVLISKAVSNLSKELIFVNDQKNLSLSDMVGYVEQLQKEHGCKLVVMHGIEEIEGMLIDEFATEQIIIILGD